MKRYIDLFKQQETQNKTVINLNRTKKIGYILIMVLVALVLIEAGVYIYFSRTLAQKRSELQRYNGFIVQNQVFDSKIHYFGFKYGLLKQYLAQDANVSYYYGLLDAFLRDINSPATVAEFTLNNERIVQFGLSFNSYQEAVGFMSSVESKKMANYFDELQMKEFTLENKKTDTYVLEFEGVFKKVKDAT